MLFILLPVFGAFGLALVVIFFLIYNKTRKLKQVKDINQLKRGSVTEDYSINAMLNAEKKEQLRKFVRSSKGRINELDKGEMILYLGNSFKTQMFGFKDAAIETRPVRIVLIPQGGSTKVMMDEDYGFQKFNAQVQAEFAKSIQEAFEHYKTVLDIYLVN